MYIPTTLARGTNSAELKPYVYKAELIPLVWHELEAALLPGFKEADGMLEPKLVYQWLLEGHATAFATMRDNAIVAALVIMPVQYAEYKVARIILAAGKDLKGAMEFIDALEAWAFTQGCVEIEGWVKEPVRRLARRFGWTTKRVIITRDLRRKLQ